MLYEAIQCAFISILPYPVYNTYIIENMRKNQQDELVFKSTNNDWISIWWNDSTALKFNQRINMENQKQNLIGCKDFQDAVTLLLCKIQDLQDPTMACRSWIQDTQDPANSFLSEIQDP